MFHAGGRGIAQSHAEAVKWYRAAAVQGKASAQFFLGGMYAEGQGVPQDPAKAHLWFNLAAANRLTAFDAAGQRNEIAANMTSEALAAAQARASACMSSGYQDCD